MKLIRSLSSGLRVSSASTRALQCKINGSVASDRFLFSLGRRNTVVTRSFGCKWSFRSAAVRHFQSSAIRCEENKNKPVQMHPEDSEDSENSEEQGESVEEYIGVFYHASKVKKYSAEIELEGLIISGGEYWTALDAAKAYDELVDLYCDLDAPRNFPGGFEDSESAEIATSSVSSDWEIPDAGKRHADLIPVVHGAYLTLEEVLDALEREKALDVYSIDLAGKSSLAEHMVFVTGKSQAHMRRMADMIILSMRAREVADDFDYSVEGRDCDDWMIADVNTIVIHFMREDTRRILNLEDHWENMQDDKHRVYGHMTEDQYMDKYGTSELMEYVEEDELLHEADLKKDDIDWK